MNIVRRSEWWGSLPISELNSPRWPVKYIIVTHIIIHHTVDAEILDSRERIRKLWRYQANDRGFGDIGYNFLIDKNGIIFEGRNNPSLGSNNVRYVQGGHRQTVNSVTQGISVFGNYEKDEPTQKTIDSIIFLSASILKRAGYNKVEDKLILGERKNIILGDRDVYATSCPGKNLYKHLPAIRSAVNNILVRGYGGGGSEVVL